MAALALHPVASCAGSSKARSRRRANWFGSKPSDSALDGLQGQEAHGVYGWTKLAAERLGRSERQIRRYIRFAKVEPGTNASEQWAIINGHTDEEIRAYDENLDASVRVSGDEGEQTAGKPVRPKRSGLWDSAPKSALEKLPGAEQVMPKESYVARLPQLVLTHLNRFGEALSDFSRCYDLPAEADRLGQRLKAVRDWSNEHVPKATLKPRKPPYRKQCNKCLHQIDTGQTCLAKFKRAMGPQQILGIALEAAACRTGARKVMPV